MSETLNNTNDASNVAISLENLYEFKLKFKESCDETYLNKPNEEGTVGQVLTKTEDGVAWVDGNNNGSVTDYDDSELRKRVEDIENDLYETSEPTVDKQPKFQPRLPEGEVGQILTKTDNGVSWIDANNSSVESTVEYLTAYEIEDMFNSIMK